MVFEVLIPIYFNQLCWGSASYLKKCDQRAGVRQMESVSRYVSFSVYNFCTLPHFCLSSHFLYY